MALILRETKGSPLAFSEMGGNLTYLQDIALVQPDVLTSFLEDDFEWTGVSYSHGTEEVEDIFKFDLGGFFDALDEEDPETFKAPILREEGGYIVVSGTRLSATTNGGASITILNGLLFAQGGDLFGGGSFISFGGDGSYGEHVNVTIAKLGYNYEYDDDAEEHIHLVEILAGAVGFGITIFEVVVPDDATIWGDVTVTIEGLS